MTGVTFDTRALREVFSEDEQKQATVNIYMFDKTNKTKLKFRKKK